MSDRLDCNWSRCHRSPNPCFAWCRCRCHIRPTTPPADDASERESVVIGLTDPPWRKPAVDTSDATASEPLSEAGRWRHTCMGRGDEKTCAGCRDAKAERDFPPSEGLTEAERHILDNPLTGFGASLCGPEPVYRAVERIVAAREAAAATRARAEGAAAERERIAAAIEARKTWQTVQAGGGAGWMAVAAKIARSQS